LPCSLGRMRRFLLCGVLCAPLVLAPVRFLIPDSFAGDKNTPTGGNNAPTPPTTETSPRPTPITTRKGDRGIGGTGFIGTITKFGSIFVNGAEIFYDPKIVVMVDGHRQPSSTLKVGYVAHVTASATREGKLTTKRIASDHELVGPIAALEADQSTATVLGQTVDIGSIDGYNSLTVGDWVAVSGLRRPEGTIVATLLETIPPTSAQIIGQITRSPDGTAQIGSIKLIGSIADTFLNKRVIVRGKLASNDLHVGQIVLADFVTRKDRVRHISIEGFFSSVNRKIELPSDPQVRLTGKMDAISDRLSQEPAIVGGRGPAIVDGNIEPNGSIAITNIRAPDTRFEGSQGMNNTPASTGKMPQSGWSNQTRSHENEDSSPYGGSGRSESGTATQSTGPRSDDGSGGRSSSGSSEGATGGSHSGSSGSGSSSGRGGGKDD
jgi:hypothetical protein